jgi:hypothetical protein
MFSNLLKKIMTNWKTLAAALDPPIPEPDVEKLLPVMTALETNFRALQSTLTPEDDVWTGPGLNQEDTK